MAGKAGGLPVHVRPAAAAPSPSASPAPSARAELAPPGPTGPGTSPVVMVVSRMTLPSWTSAARAVAVVRPRFSQVTCTSAGAIAATRRKWALVATGCGSGDSARTARMTVASNAPPFMADGAVPPGATKANLASGSAAYSPSARRVTAVASSKIVILAVSSSSSLGVLTEE